MEQTSSPSTSSASDDASKAANKMAFTLTDNVHLKLKNLNTGSGTINVYEGGEHQFTANETS